MLSVMGPRQSTDAPVIFLAAAWATVITAEILSAAHRLDSPLWWSVVGLAVATAARYAARAIGPITSHTPDPISMSRPSSRTTRLLVRALAAAAVVAIKLGPVPCARHPPSRMGCAQLPSAACRLVPSGANVLCGSSQLLGPGGAPGLLDGTTLPAIVTAGHMHVWAMWQLAACGTAATCVFGARPGDRRVG